MDTHDDIRELTERRTQALRVWRKYMNAELRDAARRRDREQWLRVIDLDSRVASGQVLDVVRETLGWVPA